MDKEITKPIYDNEKETNSIFDKVDKYIKDKYLIRLNEISLEFEIKIFGSKSWEILNENSLLIDLHQNEIKVNSRDLKIYLQSHLIEKYNPIKEYFRSLKYDGRNHIQELGSYVSTDDQEQFLIHLEKWFTRAVLCALEKDKINKQCLVLFNDKQNSGKTTYLRFFIPEELEEYMTEDISVDKDGSIALCKNLIFNSDELSVMSRPEINMLKAFISKKNINVRLPYASKQTLLNRTCSFVGSTNKTDFLKDETGSVRWIIFEVYSIDFSYIKNININQVWAQAYYNAYLRDEYNPDLTAEDVEKNELRNLKYTQLSEEHEMILEFFDKAKGMNNFWTATQVVDFLRKHSLGRHYISGVGKALIYLKFQRIKHPQKQVYGYLIKLKPEYALPNDLST